MKRDRVTDYLKLVWLALLIGNCQPAHAQRAKAVGVEGENNG